MFETFKRRIDNMLNINVNQWSENARSPKDKILYIIILYYYECDYYKPIYGIMKNNRTLEN